MKNKVMQTQTIRIGGMTCMQCQNRIEKKLKNTAGIADAVANFNTGTARVTWNPTAVSPTEIKNAIEALGYTVLDRPNEKPLAETTAREIIGILIIILALYVLLRNFGFATLTTAFPLAQAGMGYGMVFIIGLITSIHCIAMCGGINLSQCMGREASFSKSSAFNPALLLPAVLYNTGRVIAYTAVGVIVGAIGSAISLPGHFRGIVQLAAGVFMVIMGITMLGIFPALRRFNPRMPKIFAAKIDEQKTQNKNPLLVGLLNGLMPCGPLQAMQLYALSTGSPVAGGLSMFLFSMGTVPLMFGIGAVSSFLSGASFGRVFSRRVMKIGAILVTVMGMAMFSYGAGLSGFSLNTVLAAINPFTAKTQEAGNGTFTPVIENGVQIVNSTLSAGRYPAITVRQNIPVKWTINAPAGSINGCNNYMIIREYGVEHSFTPGENIITFTPAKTGTFPYSCWMGMIRSSITVLADGETLAGAKEPNSEPVPAGVTIPAEKMALAEIDKEGFQKAAINLRDDGLEPAVIVVKRGLPMLWIINNNSLDPGNSRLVFPAYYTQIDIKQGDNVIQLMPLEDFDFSTADNVFYGYVKVVDDLSNANREAIKTEVSNFETMIYPETYFESAASAGGCCERGAW